MPNAQDCIEIILIFIFPVGVIFVLGYSLFCSSLWPSFCRVSPFKDWEFQRVLSTMVCLISNFKPNLSNLKQSKLLDF